MASNSFINIDGFIIYDLFNFIPKTPVVSMAEFRAGDGTLRSYTRYVKKAFDLEFPKLSFDQANALEIILSKTGVGVLHTITWGTSKGNFVFDGSTFNVPFGRILSKCRAKPWTVSKWPNQISNSSAKISFEEA